MGLDIQKTTVNNLQKEDAAKLFDFEGLLGSYAEQRSHIALMERIERLCDEPPCSIWPDAFFASTENVADTQTAKQICKTCPVIMQCAEHAIRFNIPDGVWGGLTGYERNKMRIYALRKNRRDKKKVNSDG